MGYNSALEVLEKIIDAYFNRRSVEETLSCVTDTIKWIGTESYYTAYGKTELRTLLENNIAEFTEPFKIECEHPQIQDIDEKVTLVTVCVHQTIAGKEGPNVVAYASILCVKGADGWLITSLHASIPNFQLEKYHLKREIDEKRKKEQMLIAGIPGGVAIYRLKKNGKIVTDYVSDGLGKLCGYETGSEFRDYLKDNALINVVEQDRPAVLEAVGKSIEEHQPLSIMYRIYHKSGGEIMNRLDAKLIDDDLLDDDQAVFYAVHTMVSEESKVIIKEQKRLKQLIDEVPTGIGIFEINRDSVSQTYMNDAFYEMLGTNRDARTKFFGKNAIAAAHPDDLGNIKDAIKKLLSGENLVKVNYRLSVENNQWFWVQLAGSVAERKEQFVKVYAVFTDFNEVMQSKQELERGRITLSTALQSAKVLSWRYDYRTKQITDSGSLGETYNLPKVVYNVPETIIQKGFIAEDDVDAFRKLFDRLPNNKTEKVIVKSWTGNHNEYLWYNMIYIPTFDSKSNYSGSIGVAIDVTEQHIKEQEYEEQLRLNRIAAKDALGMASYNLSQNKITEWDSSIPEIEILMDCTTADEMLRNLRENCVDAKDKTKFDVIFNTAAMINSFSKGISHIEIRHHLKGKNGWVLSTFDMIENPQTKEIEAIVILRDITDIVRAEMVIDRLLHLDYQNVMLIDGKTGEIVSFKLQKEDENLREMKALRETLGSQPKSYETFLRKYAMKGSADRVAKENSLEKIVEKLKETEKYETIYALEKDGAIHHYRTNYSYLAPDENVLLCAVQNITDTFEQEKQQQQALSQALKNANQANKAKTEFMSRMSHDMRTPLNAIIGLSALTLDDADNHQVVVENMSKMRQATDFLLGLVNDILDMARIEDGLVSFNTEPYRYSDFLLNMKTMFKPQCDAKGIELSFVEPKHIDPIGMTDIQRINQIFFNIFSNAVKYTPTGGKIYCSIQNMRIEGNRIYGEYIIQDTGIGMSENFLQHVFEPFMQEDGAVTPELQGSGLGLSITKQLVELMGGSINIESKKGQGTKVIVGMSFEMVDEKNLPRKETVITDDSGKLDGKRILLVEDHPLNAQIARKLLEKKNMKVSHAENGRVAVEKIAASELNDFDIILMDIRMPEMSGFEASKKIRSLDRADAKAIPIIAMSANAYNEDIEEGMKCGMTDYLTKPVEPEKLYQTILKHL